MMCKSNACWGTLNPLVGSVCGGAVPQSPEIPVLRLYCDADLAGDIMTCKKSFWDLFGLNFTRRGLLSFVMVFKTPDCSCKINHRG